MKVTVTAPVTKRCPYRDEQDDGTLTLTFEVAEQAPELHKLAEELTAWEGEAVSHEEFTALILRWFADAGCVAARSTWTTAGLAVTVDVPGDEHHT
ncbi:MAG: hypothetical protein NVS3B18_08680 [Candidatus Dormibacteria bacterium]